MFYGISKNKNGKEISDMEKYTPWISEDFSGKIKYELDNGDSFEIYREFKKKNPKIFNENLEDISKNFNIDKTKGNMFFYEQTKLEEELFLSSLVSEQQEVKLDQKSQNILVQKISNIIGTGEDTVSYQKTIRNLDKRLLEEIGTSRSQERPINYVRKRINEIENEKEYLRPHILERYEIGEDREEYLRECEKIKGKIDFLKELKILEERNIAPKEKIDVNKKIEREYIEKLEGLKEEKRLKEKVNNETKNKKRISPITSVFLSTILSVIVFYMIKNMSISVSICTILLITNIFYVAKYLKNKSKEEKEKLKLNNELIQLSKQIEINENNIKEQKNKIINLEESLNTDSSIERERIKSKYRDYINNEIYNIDSENIIIELSKLQDEYEKLVLNIKSLELEEKDILPRLEKLASLEEELEELKEKEKDLELEKECIDMAKQEVILSYEKMKNEVSPKFVSNISKQMDNISGGKYKNIKLNDDEGFMVEIENGNYISAKNLSVGTIDQLYLSLRLSVADEISEEKMPILLDETFAYFDDERLENILKYLDKNYSDRQIIIFTCSNREQNALNKLNITYNLVQM